MPFLFFLKDLSKLLLQETHFLQLGQINKMMIPTEDSISCPSRNTFAVADKKN